MNAIPWYQSPVMVSAVVAIISQVLVLVGKQDLVPVDVITAKVEAFFQIVALGATLWAAWKRGSSSIQPLTATKAGAEKKQGGFVRAGMLGLLLAISVPGVVLLSGCAPLGMASPQSYDQRAAYARGQLTGFANATAAAVESGEVSKEDGARVLDLAKDARTFLDAGDAAFISGDVSSAEGRLSLAIGILEQLKTFTSKESPR